VSEGLGYHFGVKVTADLDGYRDLIGDIRVGVKLFGSAQEFVGRAGIAEVGLNSQFAYG
jgi:hypothetical protein